MIPNKLRDNSGASLLIALLFFMICAVIGTLILTIAVAASGRMLHLKENQQSYYNIYSATKLLEEEIQNTSYSKYVQIDSEHNETMHYLEKPTGVFRELLLQYADTIFDTGTIKEAKLIKISLPSNPNMQPVIVTFHMDINYQILLEVYEETQPDIVYEVKIPSIISQNYEKTTFIQDDNEYIRYTTSLYWGKAEISRK